MQPNTEQVFIRYHKEDPDVRTLLSPYFASNHTLLADPVAGVSTIQNVLKQAGAQLGGNVRLSRYLLDWVEELKRKQIQEHDKKLFLEDVQAGKRSLQMLSSALLPYQIDGMLQALFEYRFGKHRAESSAGMAHKIEPLTYFRHFAILTTIC